MNDQDIIALFEARDEQAIKECQTVYGSYCHSIALRILENQEDAEECVADSLLRAWNAIPPAKPRSLASYLGAITRNISYDCYRRRYQQKRGKGEIPLAFEEIENVFAASGSPDEVFDRMALAQTLNRFLATLSERDRNILLARYYFVYSVKEIAKKHGKSEKYVRVVLDRTLKKLKKYLEKENSI